MNTSEGGEPSKLPAFKSPSCARCRFFSPRLAQKKAFIKDVAQSQPIGHAMATEVPQQDAFHFDWKESLASVTKLQNVTCI